MTEYICEYCDTKFKNKYNLKNHQINAKFCLEIQKENNESYECKICYKQLKHKNEYEIHLNSCDKKNYEDYKKMYEQLNNKLEVYKTKNLKLKLSLKEEIKLKENYQRLFEQEKERYQKQIEEEKERYENLLKDYKILTNKAIENAGTKNTTNINNKNQIYNALQPLTDNYMKEQTKFLTYNNIKNGAHGIAHFASNHTFKDRLFCSDKSRLNFVFKNEGDAIIKDPEGVEITKKFIDINRGEIVRLVDEYLNYITTELMDDSTSGDMYRFWADKREEFIAIRSAVNKGNVADNKESYSEFKKNFLLALSDLVPR